MSEYEKVFATVGTTKFNQLVRALLSTEVLDELRRLRCKELLVQVGSGDDISPECIEKVRDSHQIEISFYRLKRSIADDIANADLVISHAGAGSCIEVLNAHKVAIVVVNEKLMGNHQAELAQKLSDESYLLYCTTDGLCQTLAKLRGEFTARHYEKGNMRKLTEFIDEMMGY